MIHRLSIVGLLALTLVAGDHLPSSHADQPRETPALSWRTIAPDLELSEVNQDASLLISPLVLVRTSLQKFELRVLRAAQFGEQRMEVRALCRRARASVCVNGNFFDEAGSPLGLVISQGVLLHPLHRQGRTLTGVLQVSRQGLHIVGRQEFVRTSVLEAIQAGPRLLTNGAFTEGLKDKERTGRSAVCIDRQSRLVLASSGSGFRGLTFGELQRALTTSGVDCVHALNLDGGGSAQLFAAPQSPLSQNSTVVVSMSGFDPVPVALALIDKDAH